MSKKERLDILLAERDYYRSRSQAKRAIMAGEVKVNNEIVDKAGTKIDSQAKIEIKEKPPYVSRGGKKLKKALTAFAIEVRDKIALDIGSSTGGFTDCLLQEGAREVYAVDSGTNQLAWKLRKDERVKVFEQTKFHELKPGDLPAVFQLVTVDVSFISLGLILPVAVNFMQRGSDIIALIKPQFEAGPDKVGKGGVVKDTSIQIEVIEKILIQSLELGIEPKNLSYSPITGASAGNREFLFQGIYQPAKIDDLNQNKDKIITDWQDKIVATVTKAQHELGRG